jgi:hypothetical protein
MANTTNFGWETPDDTDLVKDGALAIRTLGSAIDTSLVDLKGGTTGQVLSKTSNTDMDFTWVAQDDSNAIQNAIVDAKGDLISATAADTPARLEVGTDKQLLSADSSTSTGLKWVSNSQNTVVDAEGDLLVGDSADTIQRLAIGTTGEILTVDTAIDGKVKWASPVLDGGARIVPTGKSLYVGAVNPYVPSTTSETPTQNDSVYMPVYLPTGTIDRVSWRSGGGWTAVGAVIRLGIYNNGTDNLPSSLLIDAGTISPTSSSSTSYEITVSQSVTAGFYWLVLNYQTLAASGNALFQSANQVRNTLMPASIALANLERGIQSVRQSSVTGALPSTAGTVSVSDSGLVMAVRIA